MRRDGDGAQFEQNVRRLRAETLIRLRWLAVTGQSIAILATAYGMQFQFHFLACLGLVVLLGAVNFCAAILMPRQLRLSETGAAGFLLFDVLQLSALLFLTGGIQNPFAILILAPVTIAAVSLRTTPILIVVLVAIACVTILGFVHSPLPWPAGDSLELPLAYQAGLWTAIAVACVFISVYVSRVAYESRALGQALSAAELVLERENQLSRLDGLAAAAAHELGTPLATISLVARELNHSSATSEIKDDLILLEQEARRCRDILGKLTSLAEDNEEPFSRTKLSVLLEQVIAPHRHGAIDVKAVLNGDDTEPEFAYSPAILYGIGNFVDNAIDFADSCVVLTAIWDQHHVEINIVDDGPGFPAELINQLGEPYLGKREKTHDLDDRSGLGLGIFIAKTLLERSGGQCQFANGRNGGAHIAIKWIRTRFEKPNA